MESKNLVRCIAGLVVAIAMVGLAGHDAKAQSDKIPGMSLGSFKVNNNGGANYTISIVVPPGTNGIAPKLALQYNSQGSNGLLGVGWSLSGLSTIERCPRTVAQDGFKGGVHYDTSDRWCLDGQRLRVINTPTKADGDDGAEYRTEIETFVKVFSNGSTGTPRSGPASFTVKNKDGLLMEFGTTANSQILAQGKDHIRVWALNKVTDVNGNFWTVTYFTDSNTGEYRPTRIDYTGNGALTTYRYITFDYEPRTDAAPQFMGGSMIKTTVRLKSVKTYAPLTQAGGPILVRHYR